ncbi:beta-ketoacyl synthase N-terminal-like domain-containing protein [Streptomyces sp. SAJ15]|uniref:beta-ketoacyl synthase N-terminal-like domain-containing protein n=1 Tax=Streptomyces sp. SAJ15 TaxID=2011095 RepID=UPI00118576B6|nr:beta-ketoacyl synthase N-terminal-like domain-containing protein [Streptomyces sp. SAJ15]TVL88747.1 beta-ketoacyl synthase [Streptomyces sp. SAJ15]
MTDERFPPIAIVGMAVLLPGAPDLATYWRNLVAGTDAISEVPAGRWDTDFYHPDGDRGPDRVYCRRGGFVDEFAAVDVTRFGIMPASVPGTEPDQLIALDVAAAAIADAGGEERLPERHRVGVVLGRGGYAGAGLVRLDQRVRTARQLVRTLGELMPDLRSDQLERVRAAFTDRLGPDSPESAIGLVPNLAASRIANRLDLRGPAYTVDAACASSLVAIDQAVVELAAGRCDVMLAGGVHHCHDITLWSVFTQLRALSPSQRIRPFHRDADGILIGEGTGVVVLKRLADAERDGDGIYAVIRGTGVSSDGRTSSLANPDPGGQVLAVRQAWRAAGLDPREPHSVGLVEAHGTATPAGDAAELATLAEVFGPGSGRDDGAAAVLGSVKSMIGHAMPAAGVASLVKAALAVHHGMLLPTLHCEDPHPALAATRFRTLDTARPWECDEGRSVRRAAVNAFGFGGINAHVVLEQAPQPARRARSRPLAVSEPERVLALAAETADELAEVLAADDSTVLAAPRGDGPVRLGVVAPTGRRLALARRMVAAGRPWRGRNDIWFAPAPLLGGAAPGRLAFVFPGLEGEFEPRVDGVAEHFRLPPEAGGGRDGRVRVGDVGRHAIEVFAVGRLLDGALRRMGVTPDAVAGHSVGEWNAMAMAGMYAREAVDRFLETHRPDELRVPGVDFAVLGTSARRVRAALRERSEERVVLSHDNAPTQAIVCGPREPVREFVGSLRAEGVIAQVLPFQSGFHTPMLAPYLAPIAAQAERFELLPPEVPVWSGTTASPFPESPEGVRALFVRHLLEPVRFRPLVEAMYEAGFRVFVQLGAGQLAALIGDTLDGRDHLAVAATSPRRDGVAQLRRVATALWTHGASVDPTLPPVAAPGRAPRRTAAAARPPARLSLDSALVSLEERELAALRRELAPARTAAAEAGAPPGPAAPTGRDAPFEPAARLDAMAGRFPLAAELGALLRETADTAAELLTAGAARRSPGTTLRVSTETMPYLLDHCFFHQRPGWPDLEDRRPVVPATTIVQHLMDAAERAVPGARAVAVRHARFNQWVTAATPVDVPITVRPSPGVPGGYDLTFGTHAQGTVELAAGYPPAPAPWCADPATERVPVHTAKELYSERWMFHGPAFQGVSEITAVGDRHIRGVIIAPAAPGALLDNVGHLLGYWIVAAHTERTSVLPVGLRHVRVFGPPPRPGTTVRCLVRISSLTETVLEADAQLVVDGRVWVELAGWQDRRFDSLPETKLVERFPERHTLSRPQPSGWVLLHEWWRDAASRDLVMRNHLGRAERLAFERQPPRGRRQWLLGRIAVKDAVRQWLWDRGEGPVFPAEIGVENDPSGRPYVTGVHGRRLPALGVTLSHRAETGVALVRPGARPGGGGVGIDVEQVVERPAQARTVALGPAERELLAATCAERGEPEDVWFTRFWAAKEAASKAEGTGLRGRPRDFAVVAAGPDELRVEVDGRSHRVSCRVLGNPAGLPEREYVVAWTTAPEEE